MVIEERKGKERGEIREREEERVIEERKGKRGGKEIGRAHV